jgi:hypothetical protein
MRSGIAARPKFLGVSLRRLHHRVVGLRLGEGMGWRGRWRVRLRLGRVRWDGIVVSTFIYECLGCGVLTLVCCR